MYYAFDFTVSGDKRDLLNALLLDIFEAFEFTDAGFSGYLAPDADLAQVEEKIAGLRRTVFFEYSIRRIRQANWNAEWESRFHPVAVSDFCRVRAAFHEPASGFAHEVIINPRMAFGTGHHETTHLMIQAMDYLPVTGRLWDFGTGTGILAILARKMGAPPGIIANDIDPQAIANARDNAAANDTNGIQWRVGGMEIVPEKGFHLILANINRNVILSHIEPLFDKLIPGGRVLFSGILQQDYPLVRDKCLQTGLREVLYLELNHWVCTCFQRREN